GDLEISHRETCQRSTFGSFVDTLLNRGDIFLGNGAAADEILENDTAAVFLRFDVDYHVTVLAVAAGLLGVFVIDIHHRAGDRFAISHFGFANVRLNFELPQ